MSLLGTTKQLDGRLSAAAVFLLLALVSLALGGCVTNDDTLMPWAAPAPGEGNVRLPSSLMRE
jgi:hypothetical protein